MFTKEQFEEWRLDKSNVQLNKLMIKEFPFLLPRNRWTGLVDDDYDYSYNELEAMPEGWLIAFGYEMICELRDELASANGHDIISKYCEKSAEVCQRCGKPATHMTTGWIGYFCKQCGEELGAEPISKDWWEKDEN